MKTIKSLKEITTLEVGDEVVFGNLVYKVRQNLATYGYYLYVNDEDTPNEVIFKYLKLNKRTFIENIGIKACINMDFPETKSLEALTAIVFALFREYEKQNKQPTYEEVCEKLFEKEHYFTNVRGELRHAVNMANDCPNNASSEHQLKCILAKNKLANVARYLNDDWDYHKSSDKFIIWINTNDDNKLCISDSDYLTQRATIIFKSERLAQQAIEILGEEEVKLALEPLY